MSLTRNQLDCRLQALLVREFPTSNDSPAMTLGDVKKFWLKMSDLLREASQDACEHADREPGMETFCMRCGKKLNAK